MTTTPTAVSVPADVLAAHLLVQRALDLAGKRLLTRTLRARYGDVDPRTRHRHIPVTADQLPRLLAGALDWADETAAWVGHDPEAFRAVLVDYVSRLLLDGRLHTLDALAGVLPAR